MNKNHMKFVRRMCLPMVIAWAIVCLTFSARAYTHPCIPLNSQDLAFIRASTNQQPWKQGFKVLSGDSHLLNYTMAGPFGAVSRKGSYDANLGAWENDMEAVYDNAVMWYMTGNSAYAQKSHDILIAWANTQTNFSGNEAGLDLGDYAYRWGGGASILRGTWSGWTAADTTTVQNYFRNVFWPPTGQPNVMGPCNKGDIYMEAGIAVALFCDDSTMFNHILTMYRTFHGSGLTDTLPTGQMGETGRDAGHAYGSLWGLSFTAECFWKQGVDVFGELDNRLLACGEYFARNTYTTDNPYVPLGTIDWQWLNNAAGSYAANRQAFYILQNAYKNRKNLPTPWIDRKLQDQNVDNENWMYARTADYTTATMSPPTFPGVSLASSGLTLTTLGSQTSGRSLSYANGTWTLTGLGNTVWNDTTDDAQYAYTTMSGDCAMVARVASFTKSGTQAGKTGLMIRDSLNATTSQRAFVDVSWVGSSSTNAMEGFMRGWTENWGGTGYDDRGTQWSPAPALPYWLKIERYGKQITTFVSKDGASWSPVTCSYYGNLPSTIYIGLFLCSGTTTAQTATFDHLAFTGGSGGPVTTPAAPLGVIATASSKANTVRWLASFGATSYNLLRSTTVGSGYTVLAGNLTGTSYVDTSASAGVNSGVNYYYVVQAVNSAGTSGNSMVFGSSHSMLIPRLANLAFGGTTLASTNTGSQVGGSDDAFNGDPGSKWYGFSAPTGWLRYDFGANNAQVVKRYTINSADVATRDPKDWQFQGSQDGSTWTTLDTRSGQTFTIPMAQNTYNIGNTTAYRYYRINITANNGATGVAIGDLGLWSDSGRTIPDGRYQIVNRKSNKVMEVSGLGTADGTGIDQWTYNGGSNQKWDIAWQGNGQYRATDVHSGKVLDNGGTSNTGVQLAIQTWSGGTSQLWKIVSDSDGDFHLTSVNSNLAADVSGGSTADGAHVIQWTYSGSDNQLWTPSLSQ